MDSSTLDYLTQSSPDRSAIVREIRSDVMEMMEEEDDCLAGTVEGLLRDLEDEPADKENDGGDSAAKKFFPIFNGSAHKAPL